MAVDPIQDNDDGGIGAEALDQLEPVFNVGIFIALAPAHHHQIQAALGEEELVRGVHNLLTTEVPDVQAHIVRTHLHRPFGDLDAQSLLFFRVEAVMHQPVYNRTLTDSSTADQNQ